VYVWEFNTDMESSQGAVAALPRQPAQQRSHRFTVPTPVLGTKILLHGGCRIASTSSGSFLSKREAAFMRGARRGYQWRDGRVHTIARSIDATVDGRVHLSDGKVGDGEPLRVPAQQ
jgi:hypothetical protein